MIIESIIGVFFVSVLAYLYWKSIEREMNEILPAAKDTKLVDEKEIDLKSFKVEPVPAETIVEVEKPASKPKRARHNGKFVADDKSTPDINEAWQGGKAPAKQAKPKATKTTKPTAEASTDKPARKPRARKPKMTVLK
jgi:hypothetical protein